MVSGGSYDGSEPSRYTVETGYNSTTPAYGSCDNIYCHSNAQTDGGGWPPQIMTTPTWGDSNLATCGFCHKSGVHNDTGPQIDSGSHTAHLAYGFTTMNTPVNPIKCTACHSVNMIPPKAGPPAFNCSGCHSTHEPDLIFPLFRAMHVDGEVTVNLHPFFGTGTYNGTPAPGDGYGSCSNLYCHSDGTSLVTSVITDNTAPDWGGNSLACNSCHDYGPSYENGSPKANSHTAHLAQSFTCDQCHFTTTNNGTTITSRDTHVNLAYDVDSGNGVSFTYAFNAGTGTCSNITCHGNTDADWGGTSCLGCHSVAQGTRAAVGGQFSSNSHHVQGVQVTDAHCYNCHWEANSDGSISTAYHGGTKAAGAPVDLVIYGAGARPLAYTEGVTVVRYTANGSRSEIAQINDHCIGCHSDQNNATLPFGDGKTPKQYAWDDTSVASRYSQSGTTGLGKYPTVVNAAQKIQTKAYSAHGNATGNQGGWSSGLAPVGTGVDGVLPNTRNGTVNVACYDCHNSHGSNVTGKTTSYTSATVNGGLIKETQAGKGGYNATYTPVAGGTEADKNQHNPGASLCFDCHLNASDGASHPWGYQSTFGATEKILGYFDAPDFSTVGSGSQGRFPYKSNTGHMGGHFGASDTLQSPVSEENEIAGLCTPCHDPHGVSPTLDDVSTTLVDEQQYGVPLLKGTWLSSPYKEDVAPASSGSQTAAPQGTPRDYHLDQNTFGGHIMQLLLPTAGITQTESQFAGLCLKCHPKESLTDGVTHTWKSKDRVHESVKGWKTSPGTAKHKYSCSKCHSPHGGTGLPRLMMTNCLDWTHKGRVASGTPIIQNAYSEVGGGGGNHPGTYDYDDQWYEDNHWEPRQASLTASCHEGNSGIWSDQRWNQVTPWSDAPTLTITSAPVAQNFTDYPSNPEVKATVSWGTNLLSDSTVDFGLTTSYDKTASSSTPTSSHTVALVGMENHNTYHYQVRSSTYAGQVVASGDRTFNINVGPNQPTRVDRLNKSCPGGGCSVTVAWNPTTDPDNGTVWYEIEYDTSVTFASANKETTGWLPGIVSGPTLTADIGPLTTDTLWYWRVRARDNDYPSAISSWSLYDSFRTLPDYPNPPAPVLKYEGNVSSCGIPANPECSISLEWRVSSTSDPDLGPIEYYLEIDSDSAFASANKQVIDYPAGTFGGYYMIADVGPLATDTKWYWQVKARYTNPVTRESAFSALGSFDTIFPAPSKPTNLISSPNPAICEGGPCPSVLLGWQAGVGAYSRDVKHLVDIDSISGFNSADKRTYGPLDVGVISQLVDGLDISKTWYWRVRAQDAVYTKSLSGWSTVSSFETMPYPSPSTPTVLFTLDVVSPDPVPLAWSPSTAYNSGTVEYSVRVDDDPGFASIDDSFSWIPGVSWSTGSLGIGTWYWQVKARDANHLSAESVWSNTGSFKVLATAPASKTITFTWTDAPSDSIEIDGTLYGGTGSVVKTITTSFSAEIVGAPGQEGGGEPDLDWDYFALRAPGGNPGAIAAIFTSNDGTTFNVKVGSTEPYRSWGGLGGGSSYVAMDGLTIMYAAGAGGGGGGEASFYWPSPEDHDEYGDDGVAGEGFGSAAGGSGGAGSTSLSGAGAAGSPGGQGGAGSASVTTTTMTGNIYTPRVTITLN
ncbi:MAG: CxxxxCH/CxxCH domain-containing protein [Desulfuromonadales bacterium]|nr:CxxxxCH/CxxCH domain-containing protein [Desulfuromonadales bacterium]